MTAARTEIEPERITLDERSWVDVTRDVLATLGHDADEVYRSVESAAPWQQGKLFRYERWVTEPRLYAAYARGATPPHPAILETQRRVQHHYGVQFGGYGLAYYRDHHDMMALHRDRDMRWLDETVIALLVLGDRRPFHLRRREDRYDHEAPHKGALHDLAPGHGDLVVMGGACQAGWEHGVPRPPRPTAGRISVQWRWTSRRGRPVVGASYRAPRHFGR